ncbi:hypothetical protein [Streptomyces sp. NPDC048436]|uniref:hypothetical protein n=1 Tax=Streptomyces sp. NPDC048436 TaxID=3365550 RepID=UPI003722C4DA
MECARRLNLAHYARHDKPEQMVKASQYRPTLVGPYRDHLRRRRPDDPAVPVTSLLRETREMGYPGSHMLTRRPDRLREDQLPLAAQISSFAAPLSPAPGNAAALNGWITRTRDTDLPFLHAFATGLARDRAAVDAALTLPQHNRRTDGVNNKIKLIRRQTPGRAGHRPLCQRILLS